MSNHNNNECPICMDDIDITKNCTTTECGHRFHASCLMTNVSHNGFSCPYYRTVMAEEFEEDGNNNLSDNKVKVAIDPDVKANKVIVQFCSCSLLFNCFTQ